MIKSKTGKVVLAVLGLVGAVAMGYLVYLHYSSSGENSFCNIGEGLSCDLVNKSIYSEVFGVPMSILGFLYFLGVFWVSVWKYSRDFLKKLIFFSIAFLGPSLYLTAIEIFVLDNICVLCEFSKVLMVVIIIASLVLIKPEKFGSKLFGGAIILALVLVGVSYLDHRGNVPSGKYAEFAGCLYDKGFVMYGSKGCAACAKQRAMFGDAFQFVEEIECDPRFEGVDRERCEPKKIVRTPTWVQEDEEGNELFRFPAGVVELDDLSAQSGCALPVE